MIKEDYVSFEISVLLKEKGFDWASRLWYNNNGIVSQKYIEPTNNILGKDEHFPCVTNQMAMKWLRKVHNIFIQVELYSKYNDYCFELFQNTHRLILKKHETYNSYEEAVEAALEYTLKKLL